MIYYLFLLIAIILEVIGTCLFTMAKGFERPWFIVIGLGLWLIAIIAFNFSLRGVEVSMAYAIWSAIGIALVAIIGFFLFDNQFHWVKAIFIIVIIVGVVGLKLTDHFIQNEDEEANPPKSEHVESKTEVGQ